MERLGSTRIIRDVCPGVISFTFTERWSAFDRGPSPQEIPGIGKARCDCAVASFEAAKKNGVETHFIERTDDLTFTAYELQIENQPLLSGTAAGLFIPLEWIWREYIEGSLWTRVVDGLVTAVELGFPEGTELYKGMKLPRMFLECTTKLEPVDRHVTDEEAMAIAGLTPVEFAEAQRLFVSGIRVSNEQYARAGYVARDGKGELGRLRNGRFIFADTFGTQDEDRLVKIATGELYSKDFLREELKKLPWKAELDAAKKRYKTDKSKWPPYPMLPSDTLEEASIRYAEVAIDYEEAA